MKQYIFNDCDVCLNPDIVKVCEGVTIRYCDMGDYYLYGISVDCFTRGSSFAPMLRGSKTDRFFKEAIKEILENIDIFEREDKAKKDWCDLARKECAKFMNEHLQLTLFDD